MKWLYDLVKTLSGVTPGLRTMTHEFVDKFEAHAKETPNDADNVAAVVLKGLCCVLGLY